MLLSSISLLLLLSSANAEPQDIIGGNVLPKGKRPYLVKLPNCGASLIHPSVVLTAAHCVTCAPSDDDPNCNECGGCGVFEPLAWVEFGRYNLTSGLDGVDRRPLSRTEGRDANYIQRHPDYVDVNQGNDFAIICLEQPVDDITPVKLNSDRKIPVDGSTLEAFGWGLIQQNERPNVPQTADLEYLTNEDVQKPPWNETLPSPTIMFTSNDTKSTCGGDSGKSRLLFIIMNM